MWTTILVFSALLALGLAALEVISLRLHLGQEPLRPKQHPRVSILKPLCGCDPSLDENLRSFLQQDYPEFEVLLGVRDRQDAAYPLAAHLASVYPDKVQVFVQEGTTGLNPKVNQLATLARHASGHLLVISDSNVRVPVNYLGDLIAPLEDPEVGMVTSPIAAQPGGGLGGVLDALHLHTFIGPAVVGSKLLARQDLFIGKSMAFRKRDLEQVGGLKVFSNLLAEDHALGRAMLHLGKRAALARVPICNVTDLTVKQFFNRYTRWGLMQRWIAGPGYPAQLLAFPGVLAMAALTSAYRRPEVVALSVSLLICKMALDTIAIHSLSRRWPRLAEVLLIPAKDLLVFAAFIKAMLGNTVEWRGHQFRVGRGTELSPT